MPTWNTSQYLKFAEERTQPCRDLAARVIVPHVRRVVDLGCGPGNSTAVLAARWPAAALVGIDSSETMIAVARRSELRCQWMVRDIGHWVAEGADAFDVVFSNAALQWLPDHAVLYPRLFARVAPGGALAIQVPGHIDGPAQRAMRELAASPEWRDYFPTGHVRDWHTEDPIFYYDVLTPHAARVELWSTDYVHVFPDPDAIVEWYRGTGLRPFLDVLPSNEERDRFVADYRMGITPFYPPRSDGRVLFPFRRLFVVAYRAPT